VRFPDCFKRSGLTTSNFLLGCVASALLLEVPVVAGTLPDDAVVAGTLPDDALVEGTFPEDGLVEGTFPEELIYDPFTRLD
jgi:hypothetical protein